MLDFKHLAHRFDHPGVQAIVLMGSHARGDAGPFSDVDLVRFVTETASEFDDTGSHLIDGQLVVVSDVKPNEVVAWFEQPEQAVQVIAGLRMARPLIERNGVFAAIQAQAGAFVWDAAMQARANVYAGHQMVGWIEEVHKGLAGLRRNDIGRLLNARHGLSWGLERVMQVQRGVLLTSDNTFWSETEAVIGADSDWAQLRRAAFAVGEHGVVPTLRDQVLAGLRLYVVVAQMLVNVLPPADAALIAQTVALIEITLATHYEEA